MSERDSICASNEKPAIVPGTEVSKIANRRTRKPSTIRWATFQCHCGCLSSRNGWTTRTHGKSRTRTYRIWVGMWRRCTNPSNKNYNLYGGRGIIVCPLACA